jgi:predicted nucleotidyltransferase
MESMKTPEAIRQVVSDLLPLVRQFARGEYAIALGGSYAKGTADDEADVDLYLFAHDVLPNDERTRIASAFSSEIEGIRSWGEDAPLTNAGTDFRFREHNVECWLRDIGHIDRSIAECQQGVVKREFVTWTTTGFYNHCCLSDLSVMLPLDDPFDIIARWKSEVATYPPKLRQAIVHHHLNAAHFWPDNFHYLSAIERQDVIYATGIVQQVVHNLVQVLFALNEVYFPGDKQLDAALAHLPRKPRELSERIGALLFPGTPATAEVLREQRERLRSLLADVREMAASPGS